MYTGLFWVLNICALAMVAAAIHIMHNPALKKKNRVLFAHSALVLMVLCASEAVALKLEGKEGIDGVYLTVCLIEAMVGACLVPLQMFACDMKKLGKIGVIMSTAYCLCHLLALPHGLIYSIQNGIFTHGPLNHIILLWFVVDVLMILIMLVKLGVASGFRDYVTLILIGLLQLGGICVAAGIPIDSISTVSFCVSFLLIYSYFETYTQKKLQDQLVREAEHIKGLSLQVVQTLAGAVDAKDRYTNGHSHRVAAYSVKIAEKLGWSSEKISNLEYEALMHDIGKIGIPDSVLNKQGRLNDVEFEIIKSHPLFGSDILSKMQELPTALYAARWHHERYDGKGYPDGIAGSDIPESVRIIGIADTFDAMNSDRIYRSALPKDIILSELRKGKGTQFDPELTDILIGLYSSGELDEIAADGRKDMNSELDSFTAELRNFFAVIHDAYELRGGWNDEYGNMQLMLKYLQRISEGGDTGIEAAIVSLSPRDAGTVSEAEQDVAIEVMIRSVEDSVVNMVACARISKTQVIAIRHITEGPGFEKYLQLALVYYFKLLKTDNFEISTEILDIDRADSTDTAG